MAGGDSITARWEKLGQLDRGSLRVAWAEAFGDGPPQVLSMIFVRKALIWYTQCQKSGDFKPDQKRALSAPANGETVRPQTASAEMAIPDI